MPEEFEYIERFFEGEFSSAEILAFEKRILEDPSFAEQLAFYISTLRAAKQHADDERTARFRQLYDENRSETPVVTGAFRKLWPYISIAAVVAGIAISLFIYYPSSSPDKLADRYMEQHLRTLSVTMDARQNSFKTGVRLYNEGKLPEALMHFENLMLADTANFMAKENAGLAALRLKQYDKALRYFSELENYPGLFANPGTFYHALTLMKRNLPGDEIEAKKLLRSVVDNHLDLESNAKELLEKM